MAQSIGFPGMIIPGFFTHDDLTLAYPANTVARGCRAWTTDQGPVWSDLVAWVPAGDSRMVSYTYDGSDRVATFTKDGVVFTCSYYLTGNGTGKLAMITGGGLTRTYIYDGGSKLIAELVVA